MPKKKWFVVEYSLDYQHRVQVGVQAKSPEEAETQAQRAFDSGSIWDDTAEMPLLFDDYEETEDNTLSFVVVAEVSKCPAPDASVVKIQRENAAMLACRYLVDAVKASKATGQPVDWTKAFGSSLDALGLI